MMESGAQGLKQECLDYDDIELNIKIGEYVGRFNTMDKKTSIKLENDVSLGELINPEYFENDDDKAELRKRKQTEQFDILKFLNSRKRLKAEEQVTLDEAVMQTNADTLTIESVEYSKDELIWKLLTGLEPSQLLKGQPQAKQDTEPSTGVEDSFHQQALMKAEIESKDRSVKRLEERVKQLEKEKEGIKKEFDNHKIHVENLRTSNHSTITNLASNYHEALGMVSDLNKENSKLIGENESLKEKYDRTVAKMSELTQENSKLRANDGLMEQLNRITKEYESLKANTTTSEAASLDSSVIKDEYKNKKKEELVNNKNAPGMRIEPIVQANQKPVITAKQLTSRPEFNDQAKLMIKSQLLAYRMLWRRERVPQVVFNAATNENFISSLTDQSYLRSLFIKEYSNLTVVRTKRS